MKGQGEQSLLGKIFIVCFISGASGMIIWEIASATTGVAANVLICIGAIVFLPAFLFILYMVGLGAHSFFSSASSFLSCLPDFPDELPEFHGFRGFSDSRLFYFLLHIMVYIIVGVIIAVLAVLALLGLGAFIDIVN